MNMDEPMLSIDEEGYGAILAHEHVTRLGRFNTF
jgi:hypothetical protein